MTSPVKARPGRVLAIHRYYWPDTPPYASLLRAIVRAWTDAGHRVDVLTSQPSYKPEAAVGARPSTERVDGARVTRIRMRSDRTGRGQKAFNAVWFPVAVFFRILLGARYDVVMCSTAPPVLLGAAVALAARARGASFVYHCMDLHPEIGAISGEFRNPALFSLLRRIDTRTCASASAVVVLSRDMTSSLVARSPSLAAGVRELTNFEIPSFDADADAGAVATPDLPPLQARGLRIVFTGNLGRFQGLETITQAVLGDDESLAAFQLVFMGDGAAKAGLKELVAAAPEGTRQRVSFVPHGSAGEARALMRTAHLGLVSLVPGVIGFAYPSKTATYLSEGLALLVAVEPDSALAEDVVSWGVGGVLPGTGGVEATRRALLEWVEKHPDATCLRDRARAVWQKHFSAEILLQRWVMLLDEVLEMRRES